MKRIPAGQRVALDGRFGVTVDDFMSCCTDDETPVVFYGETGFLGVPTEQLVNHGPENAKADLKACGAGRGAECCKFLVVGGSGASCERHTSLRYALIFKRDMSAQREPAAPFPECQIFR